MYKRILATHKSEGEDTQILDNKGTQQINKQNTTQQKPSLNLIVIMFNLDMHKDIESREEAFFSQPSNERVISIVATKTQLKYP